MNTSAQVATCISAPQGGATWNFPEVDTATWNFVDGGGGGSGNAAARSSSRSRGNFADVSRRASVLGCMTSHVSRRRLVWEDRGQIVLVRRLTRHERHAPSHGQELTVGRVRAVSGDDRGDDNGHVDNTASRDSLETDLAAKLAAMEAEAQALRAELAKRAGKVAASGADIDLAKLQPQRPEKRIDGTGYRETLVTGPGRPFAAGAGAPAPDKWGLSEAQLFLTRGGPTEGEALVGPATEEGAEGIVQRRLIIGLGLASTAIALSFIKSPFGRKKPPKPLFFYLAPVVRLSESLKILQDYREDAFQFQRQLKQFLGSATSLRQNLLSAAAWLEDEAESDRATSLAFEALDYLNQVDYNQYFENRGEPSMSQLLEFSRFSLQCVTEASTKLQEFLALMPGDAVSAARNYGENEAGRA